MALILPLKMYDFLVMIVWINKRKMDIFWSKIEKITPVNLINVFI
jgi:hypothetical protein